MHLTSLNDTVPEIHNLTALRIATMIHQCRLDYNNAKDTSKYWYRAKITSNCNDVAKTLSKIKGKYTFYL